MPKFGVDVGMVGVVTKGCGHEGCTTRPTYGVNGSKKAQFCSGHKKDGMVNVEDKRCSHQGCAKHPSFGVDGSNTREFCSQHKKDRMVNVVSKKRCGHAGCTKLPSYGVDGTNKKEFCSEHKKDGMVDVKSRRCGQQGCTKVPSYGVDGSNKREFCSQHKKEGMVHLTSSRRRAGAESGRRGGLEHDFSEAVDTTRPRVSATGEKRRGGCSSSLAAQMETPSRSSEGASKRARLDAAVPPPPLPGAENRRRMPTLGMSSSSELVATVVKTEAREAGRGRGGPNGILLSLLGVRSCLQGGRRGASPLTRSDPI